MAHVQPASLSTGMLPNQIVLLPISPSLPNSANLSITAPISLQPTRLQIPHSNCYYLPSLQPHQLYRAWSLYITQLHHLNHLLPSHQHRRHPVQTHVRLWLSIPENEDNLINSATTPSQKSLPNPGVNRGWIAGAVLGPIILIFILAIVLYWFRRGRKGGQKILVPIMDNPEDLQEKPQLHGDSLITPQYELESERSPDITWELPAREFAAMELLGDHPRTMSS